MTLLAIYEKYFDGIDDDLENLLTLFFEDHKRKPHASTELSHWYALRVKDYAITLKKREAAP